ncbi:MAG: substrate-binding domain-containing protein [Lachnospiraceae bacterium]|nr:substrate-binding domain-containing protein [Lachnospiraceae bacterium]
MKKKPGNIICLCLLLSAMLFAASCGSTDSDAQEATESETDRIEIGMSFDSFVIERWQRERDVFMATARELGADVNVQAANGEVDEQIAQIEYFIEKEVDLIVVVPIDAYKIQGAIGKAKRAGIPVVCYDRVVRSANTDLFISFDNEAVGRLMAQELFQAAGRDADVIMICGPESDYNTDMVEAGFERIMENYRGKVIGSCRCENWRGEIAYDYVSENIDLVRQADLIMCGNDSLAGEVIRALSERRLAGQIPVCGQDAELEACQRIVEGTQLMTVYKPVEKLAKTAAEYSVMLAKGEKPQFEHTYYDGAYDIPYVALEPVCVTKDNLDEAIISSGFHLREDVYLGE